MQQTGILFRHIFRGCLKHMRPKLSFGDPLPAKNCFWSHGDKKRKIYFVACCTATAPATVMPTIGLLPAPRKPIISTWAGTDEEPAN